MTFQVYAELDGMRIYVNDEMTTRIYFDQGVALPKKYNITKEASYEEKQKAGQYLQKKYKKLINMEDLQVNVRDGENNNISLFEGANDLANQIVNYNFKSCDFYIDKDSLITSILIYRPDLSQKVGDYPLISVDEARNLLAAGHFYGGGSWTKNEDGEMVWIFPGIEWVKHVELVYLPSLYYNVHMPYYAFYAGSLYYVPAIDPQYIINMPVDGNFPDVESLTIYDVGPSAVPGGGGGYGFVAYAQSELTTTNPWREDIELPTLPAFRNPLEYDDHFVVTNIDYETMETHLLHAAHSLGLEPDQYEITTDTGYSMDLDAENISIYVSRDMVTWISPDSPLSLPTGYDTSPQASPEDKEKVANYLCTTYKDLMQMENPQLKLDVGNFDQNDSFCFYDASGSLRERIINYNFNNIVFYCNKEGTIRSIRIYHYDLSRNLGNYPLISLAEAEALLVEGDYYGGNAPNYWSGPGPMPGSVFPGLEYIQKVELVYLPSHSHNIYIPFYAFYVDSCYFVPAIDSQYITNMPVDGVFLEPLYICAVTEENVDLGGNKFSKSEWINANPWTENAEFSTLPVFSNPLEYDEEGNITYAYFVKSDEYLYDAAKFFGYKPSHVEIKNSADYQIYTELEGIHIDVSADMTTRILFDQGLSLPNQYDISDQASYQDKLTAAQYILETYQYLIDMENPQINITNGYSESNIFTISFYEGSPYPVEEIKNYNFKRIEFHGDKDGRLSSIIIYRPSLSREIGDFPIISVEEATELLAAGHFYTQGAIAANKHTDNLVYTFPGTEHIQHVELVYLPQSNHNVYIPYYAFYAGAMYYVPAIAPQYIANLPVNGIYPEIE